MVQTRKQAALRAFSIANPKVQKIILDQGAVHIQARLQTGAALEQRVSQIAALLFAAAAVAAQIAWSVQQGPPAFVAGISTMLFVVGGVVAFHGIRAGVLAVPGADPAWWSQADDLSAFTEEDAQCWVVGHMQDAIVSLDQINSRRADALNLSLAYGAAAGGFILVAGAIALFR